MSRVIHYGHAGNYDQAEVKDAFWKIFDTEGLNTPPGPRLVEITGARISEMAAKYRPAYPSAMKCLTSCLTLVWAVLDRASRGWRGFTMTSDGLRLLQDLHRSLLEPPRQLRPRTATQAPAAGQPETVSTVA